ncbi:MAG: 6-pyruvoyl-tetrahydropterin synthase-related protein [Syntrophomonas sp.]
MESVLLKKKECQFKIEELYQEIAVKEARISSIELSLNESRKIAREIEEDAEKQAREILAEAEALVAGNQQKMVLLEEEISLLQTELEPPRPLSGDNKETGNQPENTIFKYIDHETLMQAGATVDNNPAKSLLISSPTEAPVHRKERPESLDDTIYNMKLVSFVNARHFVTFGAKPGPVHAHSWQVEVEVEVPTAVGDTVEFAKVFKAVTAALAVYENTVLNQVHPFNLIQPTTENISMYFFNRTEEVLTELGLGLAQLNLWETPTRGIQVNNRNVSLDEVIHGAGLEMQHAQEQAALSLDSSIQPVGLTEDEKKVKHPPRELPPVFAGPLRPAYSLRQYLVAIALISLFAIVAYHNVLWAPVEQRYPWGSDTWGHLFKGENLYQEMLQGNYYPQFTEYWYNGSQPFRYWAPLPYYVLALLRAISGDIFTAGNLYVFLCALLGGLSWLFLSRRMGLWPAVMAGLIWLLWQDNVRVAFSEGNMPRVLATALLPILFALFLHISTNRKSYKGILGTVLIIHIIVLCHAMIAAVYSICLAIFAFFLWVFQGSRLQDFVQGILVIGVGIATSLWWLLPSLTGGITGIDAQAVKEVIQFIPAKVSLNPLYRFSNVETFYWGIGLIIGMIGCFITWKSKPAWTKSAAVCGFILVIITFPIARGVYINLPLSHMLWPLRFSSFGALAILAAGFSFNYTEERQPWLKSPYVNGMLIVSLFILIMFDCLLSFNILAHTGSKPFEIIQSGTFIKEKPGWRVATVDLSQFGSAPSFAFSEISGLEQVFGWAWQGAITSRNIMLLNTGLEHQYYPFLLRSCVDLGATDLVVKENVVTDIKAFKNAAELAGYTQKNKFAGISVWKSVDYPYLVEKQPRCLIIGKYAGTIGLQFPEAEMGVSIYIDQYSLEKLKQYSMIILSGSTWNSKKAAEELISDYAAAGGQVFVEMGGMPDNVLAKQPEFLGVYGEAVTTKGEIEVWGENKKFVLSPVWQKNPEWQAYVPMGLDKVELEFSYYGNQAPIFGYKLVNGHKIWFLGNNITYHAFQTGNTGSLKLVKDILGLRTDYQVGSLIPLKDYEASEKGYRMSYSMNRSFEAIVPVSSIDGMIVRVDGKKIEKQNYENLIKLKLPAGSHTIEISLENPPVYIWGQWLSLLAVVLLGLGILYLKKQENNNEALDTMVVA